MRVSDEQRANLERMTTAYQQALSPTGRAYLYGRGFGDDIITRYRLGQVDGSFAEHASYAGMISIPYITRLGGVVSLKFRQVDPNREPKYLTPYPTRIYNPLALDQAEGLGFISITEGEADAIVLDGLCAIPAVAIPGVETWKAHPEWRELFAGFSRVLLFMDRDEDRTDSSGKVRNPGRELGSQLLSSLDTAQLVSLPAKDVNDAYLKYGADTIREVAGV